jgi:hypothetical protein
LYQIVDLHNQVLAAVDSNPELSVLFRFAISNNHFVPKRSPMTISADRSRRPAAPVQEVLT